MRLLWAWILRVSIAQELGIKFFEQDSGQNKESFPGNATKLLSIHFLHIILSEDCDCEDCDCEGQCLDLPLLRGEAGPVPPPNSPNAQAERAARPAGWTAQWAPARCRCHGYGGYGMGMCHG